MQRQIAFTASQAMGDDNVSLEPLRPYRFDIFKGTKDESGKIRKIKSVGCAYRREGCKTYTLHVHTFLNEVFYLLPGIRERDQSDFVILTREPSQIPGKKFFWNLVGEGRLVSSESAGTIHLAWDMLGATDIYMSLYPKNVSTSADSEPTAFSGKKTESL